VTHHRWPANGIGEAADAAAEMRTLAKFGQQLPSGVPAEKTTAITGCRNTVRISAPGPVIVPGRSRSSSFVGSTLTDPFFGCYGAR